MTSDRKLLWATWFGRICLLFGTLGNLFAVYMSIFVEPDVMQSCACAATALLAGTILSSTFPQLRIRYRVDELRKQFAEHPDSSTTSIEGASTKNGLGHFITLGITVVITFAFIIFNFVLGRIAYLNGRNSEFFFHIVVVVATILIFNSVGLIYVIDEDFKKVEKRISQYKKDQASRNCMAGNREQPI